MLSASKNLKRKPGGKSGGLYLEKKIGAELITSITNLYDVQLEFIGWRAEEGLREQKNSNYSSRQLKYE